MNILIAISFVILFQAVQSSPLNSRIVGGTTATLGQFPFAVALRVIKADGSASLCGGSLIDKKWILTAAHCLKDRVTVRYTLGSLTQQPYTGTISNTSHFYVHPNFIGVNPNFQSDVGLIKLETEAVLSTNIKTIALTSKITPTPTYLNQDLISFGWGVQGDGGAIATYLQYAHTEAVDLPTCQSYIPATSDHICISTADGKGPCKGDSGTGLITNTNPPKLIGSFSFLSACSLGIPTAYTRIMLYLDYINNVTGLNF